MNKETFIQELKSKLRHLPQEEIDNALSYYLEYFQEAGIEDDQDVLVELDSPSKIASQILSEYAVKDIVVDKHIQTTKPKRNISVVWFVILAILASPIALPLGIGLIAIIFALVMVVFAVGFAFLVTSLALIFSGIFCIVAGVAVLTQGIYTTIFFVGIGLVCIGIGVVMGIGIFSLSPIVFRGIARGTTKLINRFSRGKQEKEGIQ